MNYEGHPDDPHDVPLAMEAAVIRNLGLNSAVPTSQSDAEIQCNFA